MTDPILGVDFDTEEWSVILVRKSVRFDYPHDGSIIGKLIEATGQLKLMGFEPVSARISGIDSLDVAEDIRATIGSLMANNIRSAVALEAGKVMLAGVNVRVIEQGVDAEVSVMGKKESTIEGTHD